MKSVVPLPIFSEVKAAAEKPRGWPFLRLGFRPFYFGASLLAFVLVPLWVAVFLAGLTLNLSVPGFLWHAHEMLFGFAVAVIAGFLLTAGKNWTGLATPRGPALAALTLLWLSARIAAFSGSALVYAVLDMAFLPVVAAILTRLLLRARNYRNLPLAGMLMLLAVSNLLFHLTVSGILDGSPLTPLYAALALVVTIESVMAGRVIPAFTMAANPGLKLPRQPRQEWLTLGLTVLGLLAWLLALAPTAAAIVLALAGLLQLRRLLAWQPLRARAKPVLWILHAAYLWIPVGLLLLALAQVGLIAASAGVHALGVGATGGLIMGMMTRTARGHTGRPLVVSRAEVVAYALVLAAALLRVALPLLGSDFYAMSLVLSAALWSLAFLIYLVIFTPWLLQTRLDGKDG